ncbi:hypothetical protein E7744_01080 [Citricoccus sp. SGAir0253]|uniref:hypothetical protein n=1 Tax=Citricoccus sp. SGAir0253 TaxID=2567881 RepID=UPI0010CD1FFD|nr:hypothetical protein [Citricoccus sp. SGAir0253]QCU76974.1 hypothetical protein E7744_01080 [Citricoccus sp. SGAir0253]
MHDIDRALFEDESEGGTWGEVADEYGTYEQSPAAAYGSPAGESETDELDAGELWGEVTRGTSDMALAAELLAVSDEAELDQFLGNLVKSAVSAGKAFVNSSAGRAVGDVLKSAARRALPQLGQAIGNYVAPGAGGDVGRKVGSWIGTKFETGLDLEGLTPEDRELQTARTFVDFARSTARRAAATPTTTPPMIAARNAALASARQVLPRLDAPRTPGAARAASGRWVRRGRNIVILGAG